MRAAVLALIIGQFLAPRDVAAQPAVQQWISERVQQIRDAQHQQCSVLLVGDSLLSRMPDEFQRQMANGECLINIAIPGSETSDAYELLKDDRLKPIKPKIVILLTGTNDLLRHHQAPEIASRISEITDRAHTMWPEARLIVLSVPAFSNSDQVTAERVSLDQLLLGQMHRDDKNKVLDVAKALTCNQKDCSSFVADKIHLSDPGYAILTGLILGVLNDR